MTFLLSPLTAQGQCLHKASSLDYPRSPLITVLVPYRDSLPPFTLRCAILLCPLVWLRLREEKMQSCNPSCSGIVSALWSKLPCEISVMWKIGQKHSSVCWFASQRNPSLGQLVAVWPQQTPGLPERGRGDMDT